MASSRNLDSTMGAQASPKMGGRNQVSRRVSAPCWHVTPFANAPWKPLNSVQSLNRCRVGKTGLYNQSICKPQKGTEPGVRRGKRSLLACHTRCKCSLETTHNSVKVKVGIKVMKLVESLIGLEVTVGQGSECHLTFERGKLHIAE